jgi:hypothetical protein
MNPLIQLNTPTQLFLIVLVVARFAVPQSARAVVPPPDGGYPGGNTAEGQNALLNLTTGGFNTAVGFFSLGSNTVGAFNTGIGAGALLANTADENTATGAGALLSNTAGNNNTANGTFALSSNTVGADNTATGFHSLSSNTTASENTATGFVALRSNTTGGGNTADGSAALSNNTTAGGNTAMGFHVLTNSTTGGFNTAGGANALLNNTTGNDNVALGSGAGRDQTTGSGNVYIGSGEFGIAGESNTCYIRGIFNQTSLGGVPVLINGGHKLGTTTSSKRFKEAIKPMGETSELIFALKPVTFRYRKEIDPNGTPQFGLVAEDVEKVNPDLVVRDKEGKPYSVRYDQVNTMLLNEFLKEHRKVEEQEATIAELKTGFQRKLAEQQKQIEALTSGLEKVSAQLEVHKAAPRAVLNGQ